MSEDMDWGEWFTQWFEACDSFHRAYRDEKTCSTVLGSIIAHQQRLMDNIPPVVKEDRGKST